MSVTFSWGSDKDQRGTVIDANATKVSPPTSATDADIALIAQLCPRLQTLNLIQCEKITDSGLMHLATLEQLQTLGTDGTRVTDAGRAAFRAAQAKAKAAASDQQSAAAAQAAVEEFARLQRELDGRE
jgi:hypothetical protein